MAYDGQRTRELEMLLHDVADTTAAMLSLVRELTGVHGDPTLDDEFSGVTAAMRDVVLPELMDQESRLEGLLENTNPGAYMEWLMSVPPQAMIFAVRKDRFRDCQAQMAEIGH